MPYRLAIAHYSYLQACSLPATFWYYTGFHYVLQVLFLFFLFIFYLFLQKIAPALLSPPPYAGSSVRTVCTFPAVCRLFPSGCCGCPHRLLCCKCPRRLLCRECPRRLLFCKDSCKDRYKYAGPWFLSSKKPSTAAYLFRAQACPLRNLAKQQTPRTLAA